MNTLNRVNTLSCHFLPCPSAISQKIMTSEEILFCDLSIQKYIGDMQQCIVFFALNL